MDILILTSIMDLGKNMDILRLASIVEVPRSNPRASPIYTYMHAIFGLYMT
jgi:hypothetical protein